MRRTLLALIGAFLGLTQSASAQTVWQGSLSASWGTAANWSAGTPDTGVIATFNSAGNGNTAIVLSGAQRNLGGLLFDTAACAAYTFSNATGDAFNFDLGGSVVENLGVTAAQIINTPILTNGALGITNNGTGLLTFAGPFTLNTGTADVLTVGGTGNVTISGVIGSGASALTKTGAGTLTLSGVNTYAGLTTLSGGTLSFAAITNLGANTAGNSIALSGGGNLSYTTNTAVSLGTNRSIVIGTGGGTITTPTTASVVLTINGNISGTGNLQKLGNGILALSGDNSGFSGNITSNSTSSSVSIRALSSNALGANNTVTINSNQNVSGSTGISLNLQGGVTIPSTVTLVMNATTASARVALFSDGSGTNTWNGPIVIQSTTAQTQFYQNIGGQSLILNGNITASSGAAFTGVIAFRGIANGLVILNGNINAPSASVNKTDASTLVINSTGNSWGNTGIQVGTERLGISDGLPTTTNLTMGQGDTNTPILDLFGFNQTIGGLALNSGTSGNKTITNSQTGLSTFTINNAATNTYGGTNGQFALITGKIQLVKNNTGALTLSGLETYTGGTVVNNGTVTMNGANNFGVGGITVNGGTLSLTAINAFSGGVNVSGGTLLLSAANTYTGGNTLSSGLLQPSGVGTLGAIANSLTVNGGTFDLNGTNQTAGLFGGSAGTVLNNLASTTSTFTVGQGNATGGTFAGALKDNNGTGGVLALTKIGTGTLTLSGANTYTGPTTISAGTLIFNSAPSPTSAIILSSGATLTLNNGVGNQLTNLSGFTIGDGTGNTILNLQVGSLANSDLLQTSVFALSAGTATININALAGFGANNYTLLHAAGGLSGATYSIGNVLNGGSNLGYSLTATDTSLVLNVFPIVPSSWPDLLARQRGHTLEHEQRW